MCLDFSILKKFKKQNYKTQNRNMSFLILNTCVIKGRVSLTTTKIWTQSQTGRAWGAASSVCAEQSRARRHKGSAASLQRGSQGQSPAHLPRRREPSDDTQDPRDLSPHRAGDPQLLYPPHRWVKTSLVISPLTRFELSNCKHYEIKSFSICYELCSPKSHILKPQSQYDGMWRWSLW